MLFVVCGGFASASGWSVSTVRTLGKDERQAPKGSTAGTTARDNPRLAGTLREPGWNVDPFLGHGEQRGSNHRLSAC